MNARSLPIQELREPLLSALARQRRLILAAPTGSGKSTQVPQMLLGGGVLGVLLAAWAVHLMTVMLPADLGIDPQTATRDLLAARSIDDLVRCSGGLYEPPARFR